jgi:hypothetical protein
MELSALDLRLSHTRQRNIEAERRLLSSIMERDIVDPLLVSSCKETGSAVLLDGFKRYRCAAKLNKNIVMVEYIGEDVVDGVLSFLRRDQTGGLCILEQAGLIEELHKKYGLGVSDIARRLERSPSWVSVRLGMIGEIGELVREKILSGAFPARAYMYGIKIFTRVNKTSASNINVFVEAVSGKGLGTRDLIALSRAYFTGGLTVQRMIVEGDAHQAVKFLVAQSGPVTDTALSADQQSFVHNLKTIAGVMSHVVASAPSLNTGSARYMQYVNTWSAVIDKSLAAFSQTIKDLHDLSRPADHGTHTLQTGSGPQRNSAAGTD